MVLFFFEFFLLVRFLFFLVVFTGGVSCVFVHLLPSSLVLFILGAGFLGISLAGRVIFSFCVGLRCVQCRSGTIYLGASLGGWRGCTGFFFSWALLRRYGTIEIVRGVWSVFLYILQFIVCSLGGRLSVVRLHFSYIGFIWFHFLVLFVDIVFYKLLILF
jgi:hypothetical protein